MVLAWALGQAETVRGLGGMVTARDPLFNAADRGREASRAGYFFAAPWTLMKTNVLPSAPLSLTETLTSACSVSYRRRA